MNSTDRWFGDRTDRTIEGRFLEHAIPDPANSTSYKGVTKTVTIVEIRSRSVVAGPQNSTGTMLKPFNRQEMTVERFPEAWAHYEAMRAGKTIEEEKSTPLQRNEILGISDIEKLRKNGFGSAERFLAMTDAEAIEILGQKGPVMRDKYPAEVERAREAMKFSIPMPQTTPIRVEGPIGNHELMILESRAITTLEQIAAWSDDVAYIILSGAGPGVRQFAREKLVRLANGISAAAPSPVKGTFAPVETGQKFDESGAKGPTAKKRGRPRKESYGTQSGRQLG